MESNKLFHRNIPKFRACVRNIFINLLATAKCVAYFGITENNLKLSVPHLKVGCVVLFGEILPTANHTFCMHEAVVLAVYDDLFSELQLRESGNNSLNVFYWVSSAGIYMCFYSNPGIWLTTILPNIVHLNCKIRQHFHA